MKTFVIGTSNQLLLGWMGHVLIMEPRHRWEEITTGKTGQRAQESSDTGQVMKVGFPEMLRVSGPPTRLLASQEKLCFRKLFS